MVDKCDSCGHWTDEGKRKWRESLKPIYDTDMSKPLPDLVQDWRNMLTQIRGQISDVSFKYPGWGEHLDCVRGLLTCGLISLSHVRDTMIEAKRAEQRRKAEELKLEPVAGFEPAAP